MDLIRLAAAGDTAGVLRALGTLTPTQRDACTAALAARAQAMAADRDGYTLEQRAAQRVAELGCQPSPEAAADWLVRNPPRHPVHDPHPSFAEYPTYDQVAEVLDLYPAGWRAELVARLAAPVPSRDVGYKWFPLVERIIADTGCPVPTTDRFIDAWLEDRKRWALADPADGTLLERLRKDDLSRTLLPLVVPRPGVPLGMRSFHFLADGYGLPYMMEKSRLGVFISLSTEGAVDRDALIRRLFADLVNSPPPLDDATAVVKALALTPAERAALAGERIRLVERLLGHARGNFLGRETAQTLALLRALAPTAAESARFVDKHLALLDVNSYEPSAAAAIGYAQQALLGADEAGLLDAGMFAELSERVLNHPELDTTDYRVAGFVSRLSAGKAIDRGALIRRAFAHLVSIAQYAEDAAHMLTALALTPAEHAAVTSDRILLVEPLLTSLLQPADRKAVAASLAFLSALAPAVAENARFTRQYIALLDGPSTVAGHAQQALLAMDAAGLLEAETFSEVCQRILLRPEKKLVRAQLTGLDRAAGQDPARAAQLAADTALAFQHQDPAMQKLALDVITRHLPAADGPVLPALRAAAEWLSPAFSARAAELFGAPPDTGERFSELLPAVPVPRPVAGPAATAAEAAQEVAAVIAGDQDVAAFERALDGLVRHARQNRAALAEALKPVMRGEPGWYADCRPADLYDVARAVRGEEPRESAFQTRQNRGWSLPGAMLAARMSEAIGIIDSGTQPFLLAVPTLAIGALDAVTLVDRLTELEELDVVPAPVDLAQALLRVSPADDERTLRAAGKLRSQAGQRLARWLRDGGLPHQDSEPHDWYRSGSLEPARPGIALDPWFPPSAAALVGPDRRDLLMVPPLPFWVAQLPHHRDEMTARDCCAPDYSGGGQRTRVLPFVAEAGGPAGYAVHIALARGLTNSPHRDDPTVDALLVLAARGQLDAELLGRQLEKLLRDEEVQAGRVAGSLSAAAETGAHGTVWAILKAALPCLLRGTPARGASAFLSIAIDCVPRCGAKGEVAEVAKVAERGGSSQMVKNARLLRDLLR